MASPGLASDKFIVLGYHDISEKVTAPDDVPPDLFVRQLEYFKTHGYQPVSAQDLLQAAAGRKALPEQAIFLTFDDAYRSFYTVVFPLLKLYRYPAMLMVVTSWIDGEKPPEYRGKEFMTWDQIKEVAASGLVTVASHSHQLHKYVVSNPQGNLEPAPNTFVYDPKTRKYEAEEHFRARIRDDLRRSQEVLSGRLGAKPFALAWPFGAYNRLGLEEAKKLGFTMFFTLARGFGEVKKLDAINRLYLLPNPMWEEEFKQSLAKGLKETSPIRAAQIDLDTIVNPHSYEESDYNLGLLIDRLVALGVNHVFLQGFCDRKGTGNVSSLYFYNRVLPVEMDFLSHAVNRIKARDIKVSVWMPALAFELPDASLNEKLKVRRMENGRLTIPASGYRRLSPFAGESLEISRAIFRDLSAYVNFDGILFQDDAVLDDKEDFHPAATQAAREVLGMELTEEAVRQAPAKDRWVELKTATLNKFLEGLTATVHTYRPGARIARNIYSEVLTDPAAKDWFSQDLQSYLRDYDYTVIMAYSRMEKVFGRFRQRSWLEQLVARVNRENGLDKAIFKVQTYNWRQRRWLETETVRWELRCLLAAGAKHLAYYPDDVFENRPRWQTLADTISGREFIRGE
jgi:biofilm PGA synthesis lipoprotein PgaB